MYSLHHYTICPRSRSVRVTLSEKKVPFSLVLQEFWRQEKDFMRLNPMLSVPFLTGDDGLKIVGNQVILEYFEDLPHLEASSLMPDNPINKAEVRRIIFWVDDKLYHDVSKLILNEKVYKFFQSGAQANHRVLSFARSQLPYHLHYFDFLLKRRQYLADVNLTLADLVAASHFSSLDFFGEIKWDLYPNLMDWYAAIKSRPSFRSLLEDKLPGFKPVAHYAKLDF